MYFNIFSVLLLSRAEMEQKQGREAAAEMLPSESHATAVVSLLAGQQKLPTAAFSNNELYR